jgi:hypothetical protein
VNTLSKMGIPTARKIALLTEAELQATVAIKIGARSKLTLGYWFSELTGVGFVFFPAYFGFGVKIRK